MSRFYDGDTTSFAAWRLASVIKGFESAALPLMLTLWSSRTTFFVEKVSLKRALSSAVTFAAIILCSLATILFNVSRHL